MSNVMMLGDGVLMRHFPIVQVQDSSIGGSSDDEDLLGVIRGEDRHRWHKHCRLH